MVMVQFGGKTLTENDVFFLITFPPLLGLSLLGFLGVLLTHFLLHCSKKDSTRRLWHRIRTVLTVFATFMLVLCLMALQTFDYGYRWWVSAILIVIVLLFIWQIQFGWLSVLWFKFTGKYPIWSHAARTSKDKEADKLYLMTNKRLAIMAAIGLFIISLAVIATWFFSSLCYATEPNEYSFRGYRFFKDEPSTCSMSPRPCLVYFTLGVNVSSDLIIQFHSGERYKTPVVYFSETNHSRSIFTGTRVPAKTIEMEFIARHVERYVYRALLKVPPNTTVFIIAGDEAKQYWSDISAVRTIAPDASDFTFATGGDLGHVIPRVVPILKQIALAEPAFFAIGGDISYANGFSGCYRRWDDILQKIQELLVTPSGLSIPVITAIGNHEAGANPPPAVFGGRRSIPFYFEYFWHGYYSEGDSYENSVWHHHYIGNDTVLIVLDTDVLHPPNDKGQLTYMRNILNSTRKTRLALYHYPLYPSRSVVGNPISENIKKHWLPIFDEYNVSLAMENHDHMYKRTKLMYNDEIVADGSYGTLYVGDGNLGVKLLPFNRTLTFQERDYIAEAYGEEFMIKVQVSSTNVSIAAISSNGTIVDQASRSIAK